MPTFFEKLEDRARKIDTLLCVGLDPKPQDFIGKEMSVLRDSCLRLIESTQDIAIAFKPNIAFFEVHGAEGWSVLRSIIEQIPDDIPVVVDSKRGDISSTAEAYALADFANLKADAVTLNPYLGRDSLVPFLNTPGKGVFLLCKTSNPGSADLQDLELIDNGRRIKVYEKIALLANQWNSGQNNIGLVIGATHEQALANLRGISPDLWFLTPGIGAQGGDLNAALAGGLRKDGLGMLIPVSRAISEASNPHKAAMNITETIRHGQQKKRSFYFQMETQQTGKGNIKKVAEGLLNSGCIRFGSFKLKSGIVSPIYIDLRRLISYPDVLSSVAELYQPLVADLEFDRIAGLPYAAIPIAVAISLQSGWKMIYPRKESKDYGTGAEIEGEFEKGERIVLIDDLTTTGTSKFEVIQKLSAAGLVVRDIVVLIDRQSGAREALEKEGYRLHSVLSLTDLLDYWEDNSMVPEEQIKSVREFLKAN